MSGNILGIGMGLVGGVQNALRSEQAGQKTVATRTTQAYVVMFAACKDAQTAADTRIQGLGATGAMSYALIKALGMHPQLSYSQLLSAVRGILQSEYSQVPEFSSGHPLNMNDIFFL